MVLGLELAVWPKKRAKRGKQNARCANPPRIDPRGGAVPLFCAPGFLFGPARSRI